VRKNKVQKIKGVAPVSTFYISWGEVRIADGWRYQRIAESNAPASFGRGANVRKTKSKFDGLSQRKVKH
jgi:hypothetical protein